jgi:hypothetical protein
MNYNIRLLGLQRKIITKITTLLYTTFTNSDYAVTCTLRVPENPFTPYSYNFILQGSQKNNDLFIIVDFDNLYKPDKRATYISYVNIGITYYHDHKHYWPITGYLLKKMGDISPGYITGYLLENNLQEELNLFRNFFNT